MYTITIYGVWVDFKSAKGIRKIYRIVQSSPHQSYYTLGAELNRII